MVTMHPRDVVVLVIDVIEQHDRVAPFHMHGQLVVVFQVDFRRFLDLIIAKNGACLRSVVVRGGAIGFVSFDRVLCVGEAVVAPINRFIYRSVVGCPAEKQSKADYK